MNKMNIIFQTHISHILITLFTTIGILLFLEGVTFVTLAQILQEPKIHTYDQWLGWKLIPDLDVIRAHEEGVYKIITNLQGLRGREVSPEKSAGVYRILLLGDSFTFGEGVNVEQRFDAYLPAVSPSGLSIEIVNAGIPGYATDQEILYLQKQGLAFDPDMVVLLTFENDLFDIMRDYSGSRFKPKYIMESGNLKLTGVPVPYETWLRDHSYLFGFLYTRLKRKTYQMPHIELGDAQHLFVKLWYAMAILNHEHQVDFVSVLFSSKETLLDALHHDHVSSDIEWKQAILHELSLLGSIVDVDQIFLQQGENLVDFFFKIDMHWNKEGHRLFGMLLAEELVHTFLSRHRNISDHLVEEEAPLSTHWGSH